MLQEFKLNTDGARKAQASAGGGVVRDRQGNFMCGFGYPYEIETEDVIEAEFQAMLDGMLLCCAQRLSNICVESDAAAVIKMVSDMSQTPRRYVSDG